MGAGSARTRRKPSSPTNSRCQKTCTNAGGASKRPQGKALSKSLPDMQAQRGARGHEATFPGGHGDREADADQGCGGRHRKANRGPLLTPPSSLGDTCGGRVENRSRPSRRAGSSAHPDQTHPICMVTRAPSSRPGRPSDAYIVWTYMRGCIISASDGLQPPASSSVSRQPCRPPTCLKAFRSLISSEVLCRPGVTPR